MIFVGSKVFTHARYWQIKKYVCMIFFFVGGHLGGTENLWGHVTPQAPRSYAPGPTQYYWSSIIFTLQATVHILASPAQPGASIVCVFSHIFHATNPPAGL